MLDNLFSEQQSSDKSAKNHNSLRLEDLEKLYKSHHSSISFPATYQCHIFFEISLATAMTHTELHVLKLIQFRRDERGEKTFLSYPVWLESKIVIVDGMSWNWSPGSSQSFIKWKWMGYLIYVMTLMIIS